MPPRSVATALAAAGWLAAATLAPGGAAAQQAPLQLPPSVDVAGLTPAQLQVVLRVLNEQFCYCGCLHTLGGCLREHRSCKHAPRMAELAVRMVRGGLGAQEVAKALTDYYSSFERSKRVKLDVKGYGPPLGSPDAPMTLVEFSDFTCPYCRAVRAGLERLVLESHGRVRLFFKPFPIPSHPRAVEAATAAEWARDRGLFWKMHDQLFEHAPDFGDDDLAACAVAAGGEPADLRQALSEGRYQARIAASQAEARAAGLEGTPTLYLNGRKLQLWAPPGQIAEAIRFTLADEEEWAAHGGWVRD